MSQQINLFNPIFLKQKKVFGAAHMLQTLGIIVLGALLLAGYGMVKTRQLEAHAAAGKAALERREAQLAEVTRQFPPRQHSEALAAEVARMQAEVQSLRQVEQILQGGSFGDTAGFAPYFRALARQDVPGVWLTGVSVNAAGKEMALAGRALQPELVPSYIQRLTQEPAMQGKTFGSLEISRARSDAAGKQESAAFVEFRLAAQPQEAKP